jgi:histone H1/5
MVSVPTNKALYARVKAEAKRKFKVWPSAYGSGWLVKEYKRRGGKYKVTSKSRRKSTKKRRKSTKKRRKSTKKRRKSTKKRRKSTKKRRKSTKKRSRAPKKTKKRRSKSKKRKSKRSNQSGLGRWFAEEWINVCKLPKIVPCGRSKAKWKNYPYCRPRRRINKGTPKTARELTKAEIDRRCKRKRSSPKKRVTGKSKSRRRK